IIIVGAHLDSVPEGPGINDNGSGSAAVLEAALRLARAPAQPSIRVRFAFWGAEERGLFGSRHHVNGLLQEREQVALYINLDMVGSPNFGRFVQGAQETTAGLATLARGMLLSYFRDRNLPVEERASGRGQNFGSDDISFAGKGIPTVGLHTGAEESKADAQVVLFGGAAGRPYDPCYHRSCDTIENIDRQVLEEMAGALTHTIRVLAFDGHAAVPTILAPR
ncbi:MAG: M20/M25/M40 family metallo-hydrolase, partial [Actinomycetota bacterium]|nr:M20/M25/M40 family metallo-hydrolase [Actinomycetota bacterium]